MRTRFNYTVKGILKSETIYCYSALVFNRAIERILKMADKDSLYTTSIN